MNSKFIYSKTINVLIVDDNLLFRKIITDVLSKELRCNIIGDFSNDETIKQKMLFPQADVILMDLQMPKMTGIHTASAWLEECPKAKIIALTIPTYYLYNRLLQEIGFKGCVYKNNFLDEIVMAVENVHNGGVYFNEILHANYISKLYYN